MSEKEFLERIQEIEFKMYSNVIGIDITNEDRIKLYREIERFTRMIKRSYYTNKLR